MKNYKLLITLLLLVLFTLSRANDVVRVTEHDRELSLLESSKIFIDIGGKLDLTDVQKRSDDFIKIPSDFISRGYSTDEALWVRFTLHNNSNSTITRELHVDNSILDSVTLYYDQNRSQNQGVLNYPKFEGIIDYHFPITLQAQEYHTFYLRVLTNSCATYFHLFLETKDHLWQKDLQRQLILTAFFALIFTLAFYNLFIYFFTREKLYILYTLFLIAMANQHISYTSIALPFLSPFLSAEAIETYMRLDAFLGIYYLGIAVLFLTLFAREFMQLFKYKILKHTLNTLIILNILSMLLSSRYFYLLEINMFIAFATLLFLFLSAVFLVYKKEENSLYFLFGFGLNLWGHLVWALYNLGVYIPENGYWYFYELSVSTESLLFSIILSKKLNRTQALSNALQTHTVLIKELHHRVKNNLQFIVSFYRLKLRKYLDRDGKLALKDAEQSVRSIGKIHEILYAQNNLAELDTKLYFEHLCQEIKQGYTTKDVTVTIQSDLALPVDEAVHTGIVINELVTNAFKYAFGDNKGDIFISLTKQQDRKVLHFKDNGKGFDFYENKSSFGLTLISELIHNELKGKIVFQNNNGAEYFISWS